MTKVDTSLLLVADLPAADDVIRRSAAADDTGDIGGGGETRGGMV